MKDKLQKVLLLVIKYSVYVVANIIPKKRDLWVFGGWFGMRYSDNPKAFFEYVNKYHKDETKAVWITKNPDIVKEVRCLGYRAYTEKSYLGLWCQLRANKAIICQSLHDDVFSPCIGKKTEVVQLWHGTPLKKIMFDVFGDRENKKNSFGNIADWLSPYNRHRNDIVISTGKHTQAIFAKAFRISENKVLTCGFPRNDVFFDNIEPIQNKSFQCIYMPTFRGGIESECDLFGRYGFNLEKMEIELQKHNIQLTLRMHPVNKPPPQIVEQLKESSVVKLDVGGDIYQTINNFDCLITDYSSIYFDFLLSNKPIIFAPFDLEQYKQRERSLYFEFEEVTLKPYCYSWNDVLNQIITFATDKKPVEYNSQYMALKRKFHDNIDIEPAPFSCRLYQELTH